MAAADDSSSAANTLEWADRQEALLKELLAEHRKMSKRLDDALLSGWPTSLLSRADADVQSGLAGEPVFSAGALAGTALPADCAGTPNTISTVDAGAGEVATTIDESRRARPCDKVITDKDLPSERLANAVWFSIPSSVISEKRLWGELGAEKRLEFLVTSYAFQVLCSVVILANAVYMGFAVEFHMGQAVDHLSQADQPVHPEDLSLPVEVFFCAFFCVELALKLCCHKVGFFTGEGRTWNMIDLVLVLLGVLGLTGVFSSVDLMFLRALRIFRNATSTLRVFRLARFCTELRVMVQSIVVSLRSFLWCCFLLAILMYMCAVVFVDGIASYILSMASAEIDEDVRAAATEHWGSLGRAMFTEYKSVTGGNPWGNVVAPLQAAGGFYFSLFLLYIGGLVLAALKLFTGIFCQYAASAIARDNDAEAEHHALSALVRELDVDGSGSICEQELREHIWSSGGCLALMGVEPADARRVLRRLSAASTDGRIGGLDFVRACRALRAPAKGVDIAHVAGRVDEIVAALDCRGLRAGGLGEKPAPSGVCREAWPRA